MTAATKSKTQEQKILWLLQSSWPGWVPALALSQISLGYGARIFSLRRQGWLISNKLETRDGIRHGFFRLGAPPVATSRERVKAAKTEKLPTPAAPEQPENLFGESLAPDRSYDL